MDLSVLPNNNHPEKFLQLDVNSLPASHGIFQIGFAAGAALSGQRQWQNRVYSQREQRNLSGLRPSPEGSPVLMDSVLVKHITPVTLKNKIKTNPLYSDTRTVGDEWENRKSKPSWTVQEFDRHSVHPNLANYLKEDPGDLSFWLEDLYTPGYDSLLKKTEAEQKRNKICKIATSVILSVCALIVIITVPIVVTQYRN
ncbi:major intrinsically disordered NOTCH2-binding receptor 1-like [Megalops cyprinoides]|uniref:major intrinsically disordered NOTCH2-binding receptor 1-like n=1 Tax=Megalops cyprinoides TaxID=118141 RepID=UPI001863F6E2|nr:major intrinsically disordered NOTCH2-binding receptor 1-like [Megalops cyprinoides]